MKTIFPVEKSQIIPLLVTFLLTIGMNSCKENVNKSMQPDTKVVTKKITKEIILSADTVWVLKRKDVYVYYLKNIRIKCDTVVSIRNNSILYWGNNKHKYNSSDTIVQYVLQRCRFKNIRDSVIIIESASGNGLLTNLNLLLPLNPSQKFTKVYCPLEYYLKRNLIVYSGFDPSEFIVIENIVTGNKFFIKEENVCSKTNFYNSISVIKLLKNRIFYEWYSGEDCNSKLIKKQATLPDNIF